MKQIIEKLKEKMGVAKNLHVQSGYPAQVHLSPDDARQIVEALEGKTKLPIIQRIQDRTTEEEKRLAEQIAEEAISKTETAEMSPSEIAKKQFGDRKYYQIDFGNHLRCCILTTENGITVEHAVNGFGDEVPLSEIVFYQIN